MNTEELEFDQFNHIILPLEDEGTKIIVINQDTATCFRAPEYGEFTVKTCAGNVSIIKSVDNQKWGEK